MFGDEGRGEILGLVYCGWFPDRSSFRGGGAIAHDVVKNVILCFTVRRRLKLAIWSRFVFRIYPLFTLLLNRLAVPLR